MGHAGTCTFRSSVQSRLRRRTAQDSHAWVGVDGSWTPPHPSGELQAFAELVNVALHGIGSEAEIGVLTIFAAIQELCGDQFLEMMRDRGLGDARPDHQFGAADLTLHGDALEQPRTLVVGEGFGDALKGGWGHRWSLRGRIDICLFVIVKRQLNRLNFHAQRST